MMIPGANILNMALSVIARQSFTYMPFQSRALDAIGQEVSVYGAPVTAQGSFQPVPRRLYEQMGLQLQANYAWFYVPQDVIDVTRSVAGDQFAFNGAVWQAESKTAWDALDGWTAVLCVEVPAPTNFYISETGFAYSTEDGSQLYVTEQ